MENILWNTWQYLVDVFDCFLILYLFRKMMRCPHTRFAGQKNNLYNGKG